MPHIDRDDAIARIRAALKAATGIAWSVTGGQGTAWGWIGVQAPPRRRDERGYTSTEDRLTLASLFADQAGTDGVSISPDEREAFVLRAEGARSVGVARVEPSGIARFYPAPSPVAEPEPIPPPASTGRRRGHLHLVHP